MPDLTMHISKGAAPRLGLSYVAVCPTCDQQVRSVVVYFEHADELAVPFALDMVTPSMPKKYVAEPCGHEFNRMVWDD